ncbi:MAG: hypothetical protein M3R45_06560 [Pseudomonadota bacterium]|nr:hypothetical protein [Pseudomonadota bacterium]
MSTTQLIAAGRPHPGFCPEVKEGNLFAFTFFAFPPWGQSLDGITSGPRLRHEHDSDREST